MPFEFDGSSAQSVEAQTSHRPKIDEFSVPAPTCQVHPTDMRDLAALALVIAGQQRQILQMQQDGGVQALGRSTLWAG